MKHSLLGLVLLLVMATTSAEQTLFFVGDEDNKPECFINAAGEVTGSDVDIIRELAKRLNLDINIQLTPWVRVLAMVESGQADGGFPLFFTPKRHEYALYTKAPLHVSVMTVYTKSTHEFVYQDYTDLYQKKIGINRGYSISKEFDLAVNKGLIEIFEVETVDQLVSMLIDQRIDAIAATPSSVSSYLLEKGIEISAIGQVRPRPAYLTLSKKAEVEDKEKLLQDINRVLIEMKKDGYIERITNKFLNR